MRCEVLVCCFGPSRFIVSHAADEKRQGRKPPDTRFFAKPFVPEDRVAAVLN
jgi:hypothetical protein